MQDKARRVARAHTELRALLRAFRRKEMAPQCDRLKNGLPLRSYRLDDLFPVISRRMSVKMTAPTTAIMIVMMNP